ncbi:MAG TPA: hypothetical protein VGM74_02130 [Burkholderiaceae bacterium]|jgi:hypothetical protein
MRAIPSSLKVLLGRGLLALALLLGQQQATLHWLSHAIEATQDKASQTPASDHCDECVALAGMGAAATSSAPIIPPSTARHALVAASAVAAATLAPRRGFQSRAPPILG